MRLRLAAAVLSAGAAVAQEIGDPQAGREYAITNCTECHAVEAGDFDSPLYGTPSFQEIANTPGMSEIALLSFFQTSHPTMPNLIVPSSDVRNLIAYIRSLTE